MEQTSNSTEDDLMSLGFDLNEFSDDNGPTADEDGLKRLNDSKHGLIFVDAKDFYKQKSSPSDEPQPADIGHTDIYDKSDDELDDNDSNDTFNYKSPRSLSTFKSDNFDIVSLGAIPLKIKNIAIDDNLEYLQCALPDLHSFYYQIVWKQIFESKRKVKCANFRATKQCIRNIMNNGGCKILQFMGHCCNPSEIEFDDDPYKYLINPEIMNNNQDYVLLECDNNMIEGEWLNIDELRLLFNANKNDILIILSPQHNRMIDIFSLLGYKYIIGIQTFNENCQKHERDKNNHKINRFITQFYSAILDGEYIQRSFELAMTASNEKSQEIEHNVLKKMVSSDSEMNALKKAENYRIQKQKSIAHCNRFILYIANNYHPRFVVFHDNIHCEPMDVSNLSLCTSCAHLQLQRPFIGRSHEIVQLYNALKQYQIISCIGRKNYGRRTIIIKLMNYLQQHRYFKYGVIIIDCEQEQKQNNKSQVLFQDIMHDALYQQYQSMRHSLHDNNTYNNNNNMKLSPISQSISCNEFNDNQEYKEYKEEIYNGSALSLYDIASDPTIDDIIDEIKKEFSNKVSLCVIILNVDCWKNGDPRNWIKRFTKKLPKSKVIYTDDRDHIINSYRRLPLQNVDSGSSEIVTPHHPSSDYFKAMQGLYTVPFTAINIDILSESKISELFMNLIAINQPHFNIDDVKSHDGLQRVFNGKARFVKKTAAFISNLQMEESEVLTLNGICDKLDKLPDEWVPSLPKAIPIKVHHSRSISPITNVVFQKHLSPSQIEYGVSTENIINQQKYNNHKHYDDISKIIENATNIHHLLRFIKEKHFREIQKMLLNDYSSKNVEDDENVNYEEGKQESALKIQINGINGGMQGGESWRSNHSLIFTPPELLNLGRNDTPYPTGYPSQPTAFAVACHISLTPPVSNSNHTLPALTSYPSIPSNNDEEINTKNHSQNEINSNITLPRISTLTSSPSIPKLPNDNSNSMIICSIKLTNKNDKENEINRVKSNNGMDTLRHSLSLSHTKHIDDIEPYSAEIVYNERDKTLLSKMNKKLREIWDKECCNHNHSIAQLSNLQNDFNDKFLLITNLKYKYKIPKLTKLNTYYMKAFEITNHKKLHEHVIDIHHIQRFWRFLDGISVIISKCKNVYNIENNDKLKIDDLGLLIGKNNAQNILSKKENIKQGAFLLYFASNPFQINLLYRCNNIHKTDEIIIKYNKKANHYTIKNKTVKSLRKFIKKKQELKLFYCTQKERLINKINVF